MLYLVRYLYHCTHRKSKGKKLDTKSLLSLQLKSAINLHINLHLKSVDRASNIVLFYTLVLMLLTNFVPNSNTKRCNSSINFLKF